MRAYVLAVMMAGLMPEQCTKMLGQKPAPADPTADLPPVIPSTAPTAPPTYQGPDPGGPLPSSAASIQAAQTPPETLKARAAAAANDPKGVKKALFDKVKASNGSAEEIQLLKNACTKLKDKPCLAMVKDMGGASP